VNKLIFIILIIPIFFGGCDINDNNPADDINSIYLFHTYIRQENLSELLSNKLIDFSIPVRIKVGDKDYNGMIEAQGSGSRYLPKWSYEFELDDDEIMNLDNFNLSAQIGDPSMLRTMLASFAYKQMGFEVFDSDFAFLKINGENKGLYYVVERIEEDFFNRRNIPVFEVINTQFGASFTFNNNNNIYEYFEKEINDDDNLFYFGNLIHALDTVNQENIFTRLSEFLDIESYLKYHAVSTIIAATDGFRNNIIFYKRNPESPYETLPWDFDATFNTGFNYIFYGDNEIIIKLMENDSCFSIYKQYYTFFLENIFTEDLLFPLIDQSTQKIKEAYNLDPYLGGAGFDFSSEVNNLKNFISERRRLLISNLDNFRKP